MSHTPGPWTWVKEEGNTYAEVSSVGHGNVCAEIRYPADARLIAAAPDLLEALKNIENDDGSIPGTIWAMCIAAIQKAEGR